MTANQCACCGKPLADGSVVCRANALSLAERLREAAGHAEDAWTVIARQTRYGGAGGGRAVDPETAAASPANRRNPVTAFGWAASVERPKAGALRPEPMPMDPSASDRLHAVENTITTWARDLDSDATTLAGAALWLAEHVEDLRMSPAAVEAFDELADACAMLIRLVDRPATGRRLVGVCDCGEVLYAPAGRDVVECRGGKRACGARWGVAESREILMDHLDDQLVTAGEAARLAAYLDGDRTQEQIRGLVGGWAKRGLVLARGQQWRDPTPAELEADPECVQVAVPTYRFGELRTRLAETPRRHREGAAA